MKTKYQTDVVAVKTLRGAKINKHMLLTMNLVFPRSSEFSG